MNRFAALVAALMLCASLCVPCFASNNASTKKWVVAAESQMTNEQGTMSRYLKLTPYVGGEVFASVVETAGGYIGLNSFENPSSSSVDSDFRFVIPMNYPDWWRSAIPLGSRSYIEVSSLVVDKFTYDDSSQSLPSSVLFLPLNSDYQLDLTTDLYYPNSQRSVSLSGPLSAYFYEVARYPASQNSGSPSTSTTSTSASYITISSGKTSVFSINDFLQVSGSPIPFLNSSFTTTYSGLYWGAVPAFRNLSSDQLILAVIPSGYSGSIRNWSLRCSFAVSFWIDANKLPAGLEVGDEFPANDDAFDNLRDDLLKQFPEAAENIENGKATIQGWNDTETVDTDVASTSISALNALFQNLGGFLFIVSLMVFGAVVLRMLIRKAVDG